MAIQFSHLENLTPGEIKIISDWWLAGIEIDEAIEKAITLGRKYGWTSKRIAEKVIAIRTRYMELDMIDIQQELAIRFGFGEEEDGE